jgi:hypothetical protein
MIKKSLLAAALLSALVAQAEAATLDANGAWNTFDVDNLTSISRNLEWIDLNDGSPLSFNFTLSGSAYLKVVDGGFAGDRFNVFDNGNLLDQTSVAVNTYPASVGLAFDQAFADSNYSRGVFLLEAGNHSITGLLSQSALDDTNSPINATVGAVSLTAVPLPAAAWLYLTGTALMGFVSRRRKSNIRA